MNFGYSLESIIKKYEAKAEEPDFDMELRDEFFGWQDDDEESIDKYEAKLEQYMNKKKRHEQQRCRLKTSREYETQYEIDHDDLDQTVDRTITLSKSTVMNNFH